MSEDPVADPGRGPGTGVVLVVDDLAENRELVTRRLRRMGLEVAEAEDGAQALAALEARAFDLVLLDIMMPGLSGFEVLERIRAHPRLRHVPVVVLSALDDLASIVRCIEFGAEDYLPKPVDVVLLRARVGACLEKKRLRDREQSYLAALKEEQARSERLLRNMLPDVIVDRLKAGQARIADSFAEATVLFADIVGFSRLSLSLPAEDLVFLLNEVFSSFDALVEQHGLEKIKTIGDAYMVVGGVPRPDPAHVEAVAELALSMLEIVAARFGGGGTPLTLRIGIHLGPVVAGIIGTKKFSYDLWGETVNLASRMESHGVPGRVHVSEALFQRLKDRYRFEERGAIAVKGHGEVRTYFLIGT